VKNQFHEKKKSTYKFHEDKNEDIASFTNEKQLAASLMNKINTQQIPRTKSINNKFH